MLATHNSLTYASCQWWWKPFNFTSKCQNIDIQSQLEMGVRKFSIRPRMRNGKWVGAHGFATYNVSVDDILSQLNEFNDEISVEIMLETTPLIKPSDKYVELYKEWYEGLFERFPKLFITGGSIKYPWRMVSDKQRGWDKIFDNCYTTIYYTNSKTFDDTFFGIHVGKWIKYVKAFFVCPKYWAKRRNKFIRSIIKPNNLIYVDFVDFLR